MRCICDLFDTVLGTLLFCLITASLVLILSWVTYKNCSPFAHHPRTNEELYFYDKDGNRFKFPSLSNEPTLDLSVIVPAYNEQYRLRPMLDACMKWLVENKKSAFEVIVVSDGSTDGTCDVVMEYVEQYGVEQIRLLKLIRNRGKGGAVSLGMSSARGRKLLFADADGATKFADLEKLETQLKLMLKKPGAEGNDEKDYLNNKCAIVCGSRAHLETEARAQRSVFRTILMIVFHIHVWLFGVRTIKDTQCGFKLFSRSAAKLLFPNLHVKRWAFDVELLFVAEVLKLSLAEVAVDWKEIEGSKIVPVWSWLQMGFDVLRISVRYRTGLWRISTKKTD